MKFLKKLFPKNNSQNNLTKKIKCPRCNILMRQITRHDITIDVCKKCEGLWLDKGEIDELIKLNKKANTKSKNKNKGEKIVKK